MQVLRAELECLRHESAVLHQQDLQALLTERLAVQTELEGLRHDSIPPFRFPARWTALLNISYFLIANAPRIRD